MDYKRLTVVILSALMLSACATSRGRVPARIDAPVLNVLEQAERGNWRLRVHADTAYEGRVMFLSRNEVRIYRTEIPLTNITRIDRSYDAEPRGAVTGGAVGATIGVGLSLLVYEFAQGMSESANGCECGFQIFVPITAMFGAVGAMFGAGLDPSTNDWATIWQR
jgi:hypothetical protein